MDIELSFESRDVEMNPASGSAGVEESCVAGALVEGIVIIRLKDKVHEEGYK